jgi:hypothetical protein
MHAKTSRNILPRYLKKKRVELVHIDVIGNILGHYYISLLWLQQ